MTQRCRHDLALGTFGACAPLPADAPRHVYITAGGTHFHVREDCGNLSDGQIKAEAEGWQTHPIERIPYAVAIARDRSECSCVRERVAS